MRNDSAWMSPTAEARGRVQTTPATARALTVVAVDSASDGVVARLAERSWNGVSFFPAAALRPLAPMDTAEARTPADRTGNLLEKWRRRSLCAWSRPAG